MWTARKVIGDVDKLKENKADKKDIQANFDELAENDRALVKRLDEHYQNLNQRLDTFTTLIVGLTKNN